MKFFLDQMIDRTVAQQLRGKGHDVEYAFEKGMGRSNDFEILD
jgi:hypothetical protein